MIDRRAFTAATLLAVPAAFAGASAPAAAADAASTRDRAARFGAAVRRIERRSRGRLGVCIVDTASDSELAYRPDERFLLCSTFKLMASAFVLRRVDLGRESLDRVVPYTAADLVGHSPVTTRNVAAGAMTMGALCEATITTSDNGAANLILASYGGPPALTAFLRSIGDGVTRLDRTEPTLNRGRPGDPRDTTSPRAMLASMRQAVLGELLTAPSRQTLQRWLIANTTGGTRLRAGLPAGWRIGDKTGTSGAGNNNDIAVVWPPGRAPLLVTAYLADSPAADADLDRTLAEVGELVALTAAA